MMAVLTLLLHAVLVGLMAPTLAGMLAGDAAQPWRDLARLARRPSLQPHGASFIFAAMPALSFGAAAVATLLVPSFALGMATAPAADFIVVAGLLGLSSLAPALATYDAAAAQSYSGAQVAAARLPAEPVLLLVVLAALLMSGGTSLEAAALRDGLPGLRLPGVLAGLALLAVVASEPPVPAIYSGRALAFVTLAAQLRRVAGLSLVAVVGFPFGLAAAGSGLDAWVVAVSCWALKLGILGALAAVAAPRPILLPAAALLAIVSAVILGAQGRV